MARMFANPHLTAFTVGADTAYKTLIGSASLRVNNEVIDNTALLDLWKQKALGPGEWSVDVEVPMDSGAATDLVALAASRASVAIVITMTVGSGRTFYGAGNVVCSSAENVIDGAIRQRGTLEGITLLDVTV